MISFKRLCAALLVFSTIFASCKGLNGRDGPTGPTLTGNILGEVVAFGEFGDVLNRDGVSVSIDNSIPPMSIVTDSAGRYEFKNVNTGTYDLTYSKPDFGTMKKMGLQHIGGNAPTYISALGLYKNSTSIITSLEASISTGLVKVSGTVTSSQRINYPIVRIFFGKNSTVTSRNYDFSYVTIATAGKYGFSVDSLALQLSSIVSRNTLYMTAYADICADNGPPLPNWYFDIYSGNYVFPNLNLSGTARTTLVVP
jgi:hypothetical protein